MADQSSDLQPQDLQQPPTAQGTCLEHTSCTGDGDAAVVIPSSNPCSSPSSIYDLYSTRQRYIILFAAAVASILVPFSDTVYLPALQTIQSDLSAAPELVAASVSLYMFMVGVGALVWGPASDRYGRRVTYMVCFVAFTGSTLGCIFAPTATLLVVFRGLQGAAVASNLTTGQAVVADVFPPSMRGRASGIFMIPLLIGPVIGPLLGGGLSEAFGWRSTFMALAAFGGLAVLLILVLVPETHQYLVLARLSKTNPAAAEGVKERGAIVAEPPVFHAPWVPLRYLLEPSIAPHALVAFVTFGANFASLTEIPAALAAPPYNLSAGLIGVTFLSDGISGLIGSPLGGWMSDHAAAAHPNAPEARLMHNTLSTLITMPVGLLVYAWSLHYRTYFAAIVVAQFLIGWGTAVCLAGTFGFLTTLKQSAAAGAAAAVQTSMFVGAGVLILVSAAVVRVIGFGPWFTVLAGLQLLVTGFAYLQILRKKRRATAAAAPAAAAPAAVSSRDVQLASSGDHVHDC